jgi:predicted hotdog family 3-hydroxylacyl-ACP dehydratase
MTGTAAPAALIPHAGGMCLLERVESWSVRGICCLSASHRRRDHPLRRDGVLASIHLLEYAAQATAVHGALLEGSGTRAPLKYLAGARDFSLHVDSLDEVTAELRIDAECLQCLSGSGLYAFKVSAGGRFLAAGRLTVVPAAGPRS